MEWSRVKSRESKEFFRGDRIARLLFRQIYIRASPLERKIDKIELKPQEIIFYRRMFARQLHTTEGKVRGALQRLEKKYQKVSIIREGGLTIVSLKKEPITEEKEAMQTLSREVLATIAERYEVDEICVVNLYEEMKAYLELNSKQYKNHEKALSLWLAKRITDGKIQKTKKFKRVIYVD